MRWILLTVTLACLNASFASAEEPLVEQYLHSGKLARGEQALESALDAAPDNDQLRFGLAVLRLVRGVEQLGQSLYQFGCLITNTNAPFVRVPVPQNPDPSRITWADYCRMLDAFRASLGTVESTLAGIKADEVNLPLRLADIRLDMTGKGEANERFSDILKKLMGPQFHLPKDNPDFLVHFDRGDVAWLRAYCHLLMGMIDVNLAIDGERYFYMWADQQFANPKRSLEGTGPEGVQELYPATKVKEPARFRHFRLHMLKVCELNRETWKFIRAEKDDDHEWLPNPRQTGVLRMPVTDEMITAWLKMIAEVEALFEGKKVIPKDLIMFISNARKGKGFNLRAFLDNPPDVMDWGRLQRDGVRDQYLDSSVPDVEIWAFIGVFTLFQNSLAVGYAVWFN